MSLPTKSLCLLACLCFVSFVTHDVCGQEQLTAEETKQAYINYTLGLFKNYDSDKSGTIDIDEREKMRRKPDMAADINKDGELTVEELSNHLISKAGVSRIAIAGNRKKAVKKPKRNSKGDKSVDISVWIVKCSDSMDVTKLKDMSKETVEAELSKVTKDASIQFEEFHLQTTSGRKFKLSKANQVPVVEGQSRSRDGTMHTQTSNYDVGTLLNARTSFNGQNVVIDFNVSKSWLEDSDVSLYEVDEKIVFAKTIQSFELEAGVECESGKTSVVQSKNETGSWAFIFCVDEVAKETTAQE